MASDFRDSHRASFDTLEASHELALGVLESRTRCASRRRRAFANGHREASAKCFGHPWLRTEPGTEQPCVVLTTARLDSGGQSLELGGIVEAMCQVPSGDRAGALHSGKSISIGENRVPVRRAQLLWSRPRATSRPSQSSRIRSTTAIVLPARGVRSRSARSRPRELRTTPAGVARWQRSGSMRQPPRAVANDERDRRRESDRRESPRARDRARRCRAPWLPVGR